MKALLSRLSIDPYIASIVGMVVLASLAPAQGVGFKVASAAGGDVLRAVEIAEAGAAVLQG